jgi:hypothetical protein
MLPQWSWGSWGAGKKRPSTPKNIHQNIHPSAARPSSKLKDPLLSAPSSRRVRLYRENICPENYLLGGAPLCLKNPNQYIDQNFKSVKGVGRKEIKREYINPLFLRTFYFSYQEKGLTLNELTN